MGGALLSLASVTTPVFAEDAAAAAPAGPAIVGNIGISSNYMFRGISQTDNNGEVSGGFDYQHGSGVYVGIWGSNIAFADSLELDFYGGYRGSFTSDWAYDVGYIKYYYTADHAKPNLDYQEVYVSTSFYGVKLGVNYSDDYFGGSKKYYYPYVSYSYAVLPELSLSASVGINKFDSEAAMQSFLVTSNNPGDKYTDWKLGATYTWNGLAFSATYTDSTLSKADCGGSSICDSTIVFGVLKTL